MKLLIKNTYMLKLSKRNSNIYYLGQFLQGSVYDHIQLLDFVGYYENATRN